MAGTKQYVVTDAGDPRPIIAGKRCKVGDILHLTDEQAEFELMRGLIEKDSAAAKKPAKT